MRKPVLGWAWDGYFFRVGFLNNSMTVTVWESKLSDNSWLTSLAKGDYPTPDAAKLACEDHLLSLLEPLAKTYEILKENREK